MGAETSNVGKTKSKLAWIFGLIGFVVSIPNILCGILCAVGNTAAASAQADVAYATGASASTGESAVAGEALSNIILLILLIVASLLCLILSFMGKSEKSKITGFITIGGGAFIILCVFLSMGSWIFGLASGVLYILSGVFAVKNAELPAE